MSIVLHHHPNSRASVAVWMLEECGVPYTTTYVDMPGGAQKSAAFKALNPMGKLPTLVDGDTVVTESAAIAVYLADKYAPGRLAPGLTEPARAAFLRWAFFTPSVVEPGCAAHAAGWKVSPGSIGWGTYPEMLDTMEQAIGEGPYLLGDTFSMADVIFGGTLRFMLQFGMIEARASFTAYIERLEARPALQAADAFNNAVREAHA